MQEPQEKPRNLMLHAKKEEILNIKTIPITLLQAEMRKKFEDDDLYILPDTKSNQQRFYIHTSKHIPAFDNVGLTTQKGHVQINKKAILIPFYTIELNMEDQALSNPKYGLYFSVKMNKLSSAKNKEPVEKKEMVLIPLYELITPTLLRAEVPQIPGHQIANSIIYNRLSQQIKLASKDFKYSDKIYNNAFLNTLASSVAYSDIPIIIQLKLLHLIDMLVDNSEDLALNKAQALLKEIVAHISEIKENKLTRYRWIASLTVIVGAISSIIASTCIVIGTALLVSAITAGALIPPIAIVLTVVGFTVLLTSALFFAFPARQAFKDYCENQEDIIKLSTDSASFWKEPTKQFLDVGTQNTMGELNPEKSFYDEFEKSLRIYEYFYRYSILEHVKDKWEKFTSSEAYQQTDTQTQSKMIHQFYNIVKQIDFNNASVLNTTDSGSIKQYIEDQFTANTWVSFIEEVASSSTNLNS